MTRHDDELPLSRTPPVAEDVRRELEFHLAERVAELMRTGMPRDEAMRSARESFGDSALVEAECRRIERRRRAASRRADRLGTIWQDIVVGSRVLRKNPHFTLTAILTLALGTGALAAMFSIVNGVLLRALPYPEPSRLVTVEERHETRAGSVPWANFLDLESRTRSFAGMAAYGSWTTTVLGTSQPLRVQAAPVSAGFFKVLPIRPAKGRLPLPDEHRLGATPVALVSYQFWRDALGSPPSLDGLRVQLGFDHEVIGVLPPGFDFPNRTQIWWPLELMDQSTSRTAHNWNVVGRLGPGVETDGATLELDRIVAELEEVHAPDFDATGIRLTDLQEATTGGIKRPLLLLLAAAAVFLLAACCNLASGILARGTARLGEISLRSALGATRIRLVRQLLTESALLAGLGAMSGLLVAAFLLRILRPLAPPEVRMEWVAIDLPVAMFALGIVVVTTFLFGLVPAVQLSAGSTAASLRESAAGMGRGSRMGGWNLLVAAEVAAAVALLSGSVLLIKSFGRVMETELGFHPEGAVALGVDLPSVNYPGDSPRVSAFHLRLTDRLASIQGVSAVGFVNAPPLAGNGPNGAIWVEGKPLDPRGQFTGEAIYRVVGGDYFRSMGMPLTRGHGFDAGHDASGSRVVVVDQALAEQEWPGQDPLGRRLKPVGMDGLEDEPWFTVVGVVPSVRSSSITDQVQPTIYYDHRQRPPYRSAAVTYVVRTDLPAAQSFSLLRQAVRETDPEVPMALRTMPELVAGTVADKRFMMLVLGTFGGLALLLAILGIYGVVAYFVAQRTREIGVRRALGATSRQVNTLVFQSTFRAVVPGLVVGGLLTVANARVLGSFLYDVSPFDLPTLFLAESAIVLAALVASLIPAGRALRVNPLVAMRSE